MNNFLLMLIFFPMAAHASYSVTYMMSGRDADGILSNEVIEISTGGEVTFESNSRGHICPLETGHWKGKVDKKTLKKLALEGANVIKEQSNHLVGEAESDESDIQHNLMVRDGKRYVTTKINKYTPKIRKYLRNLRSLVSTMKPEYAVSIEAKHDPSKQVLTVSFNHKGKRPYQILLPKKAKNAFHNQESQLFTYKENPKDLKPILDEKNSSYSITLDTSKVKSKIFDIYYSNQSIVHHKGGGKAAPSTEVYLCTIVNK